MTITSYDQLSPLGKIIYVRYLEGAVTDAQLATYVSRGKISQEEADFMIAVKNGSI